MGVRFLSVLVIPLFIVGICFSLDVKISETEKAVVVEAEGCGLTEDEAVKDALRNAVEKGIGVAILGETYVENALPIESKVVTKVMGYVKNYEIIDSSEKDGVVYVKVKASVLKALVEETFADMLRAVGNPVTLMLFKDEKDYGRFYLAKYLVDNGLKLVSPEFSEQIIKNTYYSEAVEKVDKEVLRKLAMLSLANYIVVGKARYTAKYVEDYDMWSERVLMNFQIIRTDNGQIIYSDVLEDVAIGATKEAAISKIIKSKLPLYAEKLVKKGIEDFNPVRVKSFELEFIGVRKATWAFKLRDFLVKSGFENVILKKKKGQRVVFNVETKHDVEGIIMLVEGCEMLDISASEWGEDWVRFEVTEP